MLLIFFLIQNIKRMDDLIREFNWFKVLGFNLIVTCLSLFRVIEDLLDR